MQLQEIVGIYGTPNPALVKQKPSNNGFTGDYVGHADVTKMLIEIDPMWDWQPAAWIEGRPAIHIHEATQTFRNGDTKKTRIATMWGFMTLLGKTLPCVGSASADKEDYEKELIGDLIRNGALRFGVCINLWARTDVDGSRPTQPRKETPQSAPVASNHKVTVKGDQHGDLPSWLPAVAAQKNVTEVYDNRDTATAQNKRPWFKCTTTGEGLWPPKGTIASKSSPVVPQYESDEEPF